MKRRSLVISLLFLSTIAALILLWPSDESRIRKLFKEGAEAVEKGDLDGVMAKVSYTYSDDNGMSYLLLKDHLKRHFANLLDVSVEYEIGDIRINEGNAMAEVKVRVIATIGNETGYILGDIKTPLALIVTLEKERAKWLIARIEKVK